MGDGVVEAQALTRLYGARTAVHELSLTLHRGEIVALLGPNGAGKTTTLRMVAGLIQPSSGSVQCDRSPGLLTESPGLWDSLSVRLNLLTYAKLHALPSPATRVADGLAAMQLTDRAGDRAGELSKGLRQRVALARALLHDPDVLLLDEPTSGLDPASARHVRDLILDLRNDGRGIIISTHNLTEAEALADRIGILKVRLLALDSPQRLRQRANGASVDIGVEGAASRWAPVLEHRAGVRMDQREQRGSLLRLTVDRLTVVPDAIALLVAAGARITSVTSQDRTLEEVYLDLVGRS